MGGDSGEAADAFELFKVFVKGKGPFQFEGSHDREACTIGETEVFVGVSFEDSKSRVLNKRRNCDDFNETALLQVLQEKSSDTI